MHIEIQNALTVNIFFSVCGNEIFDAVVGIEYDVDLDNIKSEKGIGLKITCLYFMHVH